MMRQIACFVVAMVVCGIALAQEKDFSLDQLKVPSMPAASIVGAQVNEVSRPGSLKDFEISLLNNFLDSVGNTVLPDNYAVEFNPYMLVGMPGFSYTDYLEDRFVTNLKRNWSVSLATNNHFVVNDSVSSNAIGVGIRLTPFRGQVSKSLKNAVNQAQKDNLGGLDIQSFVNNLIDFYKDEDSLASAYSKAHLQSWITLQLNNYFDPPSARATAIHAVNDIFQIIPDETILDSIKSAFSDRYIAHVQKSKLSTLKGLLEQVKTDRYGFKMDLNYAQAFNFPNNSWENSTTSQLGGWVNMSYRPAKAGEEVAGKVPSDFEFILLARVIHVNQDFVQQYQPLGSDYRIGTNLDFGLRLVYDRPKFSLEAELIQRINKKRISKTIDGTEFFAWKGDNSSKFVINANYHVSKDLSISYNIGKNYDSAFLTNGDLINGLSVNFGFGGYKLSDLLPK